MAKKFSELRSKLSPEAQKRAKELAREKAANVCGGKNCPCSIASRHEWFISFCEERDKGLVVERGASREKRRVR